MADDPASAPSHQLTGETVTSHDAAERPGQAVLPAASQEASASAHAVLPAASPEASASAHAVLPAASPEASASAHAVLPTASPEASASAVARKSGKAATLRARVRAEMTDEIKRTARRHLAAEGAPNLSLRAVARDVGMVSSAVYRYFASRDDLLTALIMDAYNALGDTIEAAEGAVDRPDLVGRFNAACHAVRGWALANPHEYALTYGSPVPGYVAPDETVAPASRVAVVLLGIVIDGVGAGIIRPAPGDWLSPPVQREMARAAASTYPGISPVVMARAMFVWAALFGAINFEVFGRLNMIIGDKDAWFEHEVLIMARLVGLRP